MPHNPLGASAAFRGKSTRGLYGDAIEELDWSVGQIIDELDRLELTEKTLLVFASDTGPEVRPELGDEVGNAHPLRGGKYPNWEGDVQVPAIMRWSGHIPPGQVSPEIATLMDFLPTFAHLAKAALP